MRIFCVRRWKRLPPLLGALPRHEACRIPERQLGLLPAAESDCDTAWTDRLAELAENHVDLDRLLALTRRPRPLGPPLPAPGQRQRRLAVARDEAFCFYYRANEYCSLYEGGPGERDKAYHQGTVWPWLLGAYGDALLRAAWDEEGAARDLLHTLTPLFGSHLGGAGIGSISEIFDGDPPHLPNGCIAQAWSVAECLRLLNRLEKVAPQAYAQWENALLQGDR